MTHPATTAPPAPVAVLIGEAAGIILAWKRETDLPEAEKLAIASLRVYSDGPYAVVAVCDEPAWAWDLLAVVADQFSLAAYPEQSERGWRLSLTSERAA